MSRAHSFLPALVFGLLVSGVLGTGALTAEAMAPQDRGRGRPMSQDGGPPPEPIRLSRKQVDEVRGTYRRALVQLTAGDRIAALKTLEELETRYADPTRYGDTSRLWKVEADVIQELAKGEPERLVPILMLHHDASGRYRQNQVWHLANHSRRVAGVLADIYTREAKTPGSEVIASRVMTSLGGFLQQDMSTDTCRCTPYYERALEHEPQNEAALLGLATSFEKGGYYREALEPLRKLVKANERHYEGQLRLALNLKRTGRLRDAEDKLVWLSEEPAPEWLRSLAFQELARHHMNRQALDRAEKVLTRGRELFPDNQRLTVQYAFLLEQTQRPKEAMRLLEGLRHDPSVGQDSSRRRYNSMPLIALQRTRQELWQGAESRLPLLKAALGDDEAGRDEAGRDDGGADDGGNDDDEPEASGSRGDGR